MLPTFKAHGLHPPTRLEEKRHSLTKAFAMEIKILPGRVLTLSFAQPHRPLKVGGLSTSRITTPLHKADPEARPPELLPGYFPPMGLKAHQSISVRRVLGVGKHREFHPIPTELARNCNVTTSTQWVLSNPADRRRRKGHFNK